VAKGYTVDEKICRGEEMAEIRCGQCSTVFSIPEDYAAPYVKCPDCGSHQKNPALSAQEPVYRILDHAGRQRAAQPVAAPIESPENEAAVPPAPAGPRIAPPAVASAEKKQAAQTVRVDHKISGRPVSEKKILEDALGKNGMEMVFQLVAGYLDELNEGRRQAEKTRAMQTLMRARFPAELAARAVEFAEKSPETEAIIWGNYSSSLKKGLLLLGAGVVISLVVHFAANPGRELVFFQLPFAVGLAFTCNSLLHMAGMKFAGLRKSSIHYAFLFFASLIILGYIVWGVYF
jgi:DNA-directed RNA polymerase subunit RPC12/RpoP